MKNKIVLWGTNAQEEKVLIALELLPDDNKVMLYTFPEAIANESFVSDMMDKWRTDKEPVPFPDGFVKQERELSIVDSLLPDDLKPERTDVIIRAQAEWQFVVLSSKLSRMYDLELQEFREKVQQLGAYDGELFDSLKKFWDKVQEQARDRNILKEHADHLRDNINVLFEDLKKLRKKANEEFTSVSKGVYDELNGFLDDIEKRIGTKGAKISNVFDELKKLQRQYRESRMTNEHRSKLWERLDAAFKSAKERKFGPGVNEGSLADRHKKRMDGLEEARQRMEDSIRRDEEDLRFEKKKIERTEGQLEAQIRGAKIKMIEERVHSKKDKLAEILRTRDQVLAQISKAEEREAQVAAKEKAKADIAREVATNKASAEPAASEVLVAAEPAEPERKPEGLLDAIGNIIGEVIEDTVLTAKAVADVVVDAANEALEEVAEHVGMLADAIENAEAKEKAAAQPEAVSSEPPPPTAEPPKPKAVRKKTAEAPEATTETDKPKAARKKKTDETDPV
jgi:chromosome segregation ATPase